jgi:MFS family permease
MMNPEVIRNKEPSLVEDLTTQGRHNTKLFFLSYILIFFAAPVIYVGVVQAALCDKLGANATISNLPASAYLVGSFAPLFLSWIVPYRMERFVVVGSWALTAFLLSIVCVSLIFPVSNNLRIGTVIGQGLIQGLALYVAQVYMLQCLGRGTTDEQRARALKLTFTYGPISAVAGSISAQFVLTQRIPFLIYPYDFAFLYIIGIPCAAGVAYLSSQYRLLPMEQTVAKSRQSLFPYLIQSLKLFFSDRRLLMLFLAYVFWNYALNAMSNLSLYTHVAMNRDPKDISGIIMVLRFGFKSLGGFVLGVMAIRWGHRSPLTTTVLLVGGASLWAWLMPGYYYLLAFGLMGAGELGGAYFPNYVVTLSSAQSGTRNLSIFTLATPVASVAPTIYGALTDAYGFPASFAFGLATALISLWFVLKLPHGRGANQSA